MRFCIDCQHCENRDKAGTGFTCAAMLDLVTGEQMHTPCSEARASPWMCGPDAKLFKEADGVQEKRIAKERAGRGEGHRRDMKQGRSDA